MHGTSMQESLNVANSGTGGLNSTPVQRNCSVGLIKSEPSIKDNRERYMRAWDFLGIF